MDSPTFSSLALSLKFNLKTVLFGHEVFHYCSCNLIFHYKNHIKIVKAALEKIAFLYIFLALQKM